MGNMSAVETLQAIRAGFAALQAENAELRAELDKQRTVNATLFENSVALVVYRRTAAELAAVNENLRIANEAWRAAQNSHATIRDAALKDYKDMRRFQELYIAADHKARDLKDELEEARAYADKLAAGLPEGMLPKDVEVLRAANTQMAAQIDRLRNTLEWYANEDNWDDDNAAVHRRCAGSYYDNGLFAREALK